MKPQRITATRFPELIPTLAEIAKAREPRAAGCEVFEIEDTILCAGGYAWDIGGEAADIHEQIADLIAAQEAADDAARVQREADEAAARAAYIPRAISNADLRRGLIALGINPKLITDYLNGLPEGAPKWAALSDWEYANYFERAHPLIDQLAPAFGLTSADVDALFKSKPEYRVSIP